MMENKTNYLLNRDESPYLYIDEIENAIDSLETISFMLKRDDKLKWKWVIICLQHSLYHFCIANLTGSNYQSVLSSGSQEDENFYFKRGEEKWKKSSKIKRSESGGYTILWTEIDGEPKIESDKKINAKEFLIPFWTAFARVQDEECWMKRYIHSSPLEVNEVQWLAVEKLMYYRNKFSHFVPMGYLMLVDEIKKIINHVLVLIEFLAMNTGQILYNDEEDKVRIKKSISEIKRNI